MLDHVGANNHRVRRVNGQRPWAIEVVGDPRSKTELTEAILDVGPDVDADDIELVREPLKLASCAAADIDQATDIEPFGNSSGIRVDVRLPDDPVHRFLVISEVLRIGPVAVTASDHVLSRRSGIMPLTTSRGSMQPAFPAEIDHQFNAPRDRAANPFRASLQRGGRGFEPFTRSRVLSTSVTLFSRTRAYGPT